MKGGVYGEIDELELRLAMPAAALMSVGTRAMEETRKGAR